MSNGREEALENILKFDVVAPINPDMAIAYFMDNVFIADGLYCIIYPPKFPIPMRDTSRENLFKRFCEFMVEKNTEQIDENV